MDPKLCPLLLLAGMVSDAHDRDTLCRMSSCAWWQAYKESGECSIAAGADALNGIEAALDSINNKKV